MKTLSIGYSPCPNDTFIFYAMVHKKIDNMGFDFKESLQDVETLNQIAMNEGLDITKVSFHAYLYLRDKYLLLNAGGALGRGCGPLVVARQPLQMEDLKGKSIAIPGLLTTAFLLLRLYNTDYGKNIVVMPFHEILATVSSGRVEAGLIIHESRFTYRSYGLHEIIDLGRWWEEETGLPIPLGCIVVKKDYSEITDAIENIIRNSISYAYDNREEVMPYIKANSKELDDQVIENHIGLYVNDYSLDFGPDGKEAIKELLKRAGDLGM